MAEGIHPLKLNTHPLPTLIESIVLIHASCMLNDNLSKPPPSLSHKSMTEDWQTLVRQTMTQNRLILIHLSKVCDRNSDIPDVRPTFADDEENASRAWPALKSKTPENALEVSGVISLSSRPDPDSGSSQKSTSGTIERLFVSPFHRRKGIATALVRELERRALDSGRWELVVDGEVGKEVREMFEGLGYEKREMDRAEGGVKSVVATKDLRAVGAFVSRAGGEGVVRFRRDRTV